MNKEQLSELLKLVEDYRLINKDVLGQKDIERINNMKSAIKSDLDEQEMTTGEFAFYLNNSDEVVALKDYAVIVLDWEPMTHTLREWLIYLSITLDVHIAELNKESY